MDKWGIGKKGEDLAALYLRKRGYHIVEQNFTCKIGEIDIIAEENGYLVFIEVKTRGSLTYGYPAEAVNWQKQRKLQQLAYFYQQTHHCFQQPCRFDVVAVILPAGNQPPVINLVQNAF